MVVDMVPPKRRKKHKKCTNKRKFMQATSSIRMQKRLGLANNGFWNYLRVYRKTHPWLTPKDTVRKGAKAWCALTRKQKTKYENMERASSDSILSFLIYLIGY
ncbi:protamine-like [Drosophila pseudoobscura]|uniref:Protamine-like n=1 Tax=Drosophila pseudoobscura pseudoobscura TaxID=46245 RepID=A0A6I8VYU8_DROPS|nr:protamine [Drosophila pseudoobscura]